MTKLIPAFLAIVASAPAFAEDVHLSDLEPEQQSALEASFDLNLEVLYANDAEHPLVDVYESFVDPTMEQVLKADMRMDAFWDQLSAQKVYTSVALERSQKECEDNALDDYMDCMYSDDPGTNFSRGAAFLWRYTGCALAYEVDMDSCDAKYN